MRKEKEINADIDAELAAYRKNVDKWTQKEKAKHTEKVTALRAELNDFFIAGAKKPKGMIEGTLVGVRKNPTCVEIGCMIKDVKGETVHIRARGVYQGEAVENWNDGDYYTKKD
jgi:hypothetical protein